MVKVEGDSLMVQWLELGAVTAKGPGSISGQETKIPQVLCDQKESMSHPMPPRSLYSLPSPGPVASCLLSRLHLALGEGRVPYFSPRALHQADH